MRKSSSDLSMCVDICVIYIYVYIYIHIYTYTQAIPCLNCGTVLVIEDGKAVRAGDFNTEVDEQVKFSITIELTQINGELTFESILQEGHPSPHIHTTHTNTDFNTEVDEKVEILYSLLASKFTR